MFDTNHHTIEELSRKAVQEFSDESLIPSWEQLEKKLNVELPVKKKRIKVIGFWVFFAGLLGSFLYIGNEGNKRGFSINGNNNYNAESPLQTNINRKQQELMTVFNLPTTNPDSVEQINRIIAVNGNVAEEKKLNKVSGRTSLHSSSILKKSVNKNTTAKIKMILSVVEPKNDKLLSDNKEKSNVVIEVQGEEALNDKNDKLTKEEKIPLAVDSMVNKTTATNSNNTQTLNDTVNKKINTKRSHSFTIAAIAGTNINSVSFNKSSRAGFDYGFLAGYKLSPKFEIKTGVIFSRKYFATTGKNISFDSAKLNLPSYSKISLEDATGYCRFVEIPVMLYYSFAAKRKTSFYAGAGFSINKMRMENIDYTFVVNTNTIVHRNHTNAYHSADGYSASITSNFSFGLKQKLSHKWSIAFEPYLKIPLTDVNNSDLKLTTFGTSASLIFNLPNKKKK